MMLLFHYAFNKKKEKERARLCQNAFILYSLHHLSINKNDFLSVCHVW